jgi:hypothetical protein
MYDPGVNRQTLTALENKILTTLTELETAAEQMRTANPKPDLQALFARLDQLAGELPRGTDPNLLHYLHKKSYQKARLLLEGCDRENARGRCE